MPGFDDSLFTAAFTVLPAPALLISSEPGFEILAVNDACCSAIGRPGGELVGRQFFDAFPETENGNLAGLRALIDKVLQTGKPYSLPGQKYSVQKSNGAAIELHFWRITITPVPHEDGSISCIVLSITDVTREHMLQQRTSLAERESKESLVELESVKDEKAATDESNAMMHAIIDTAQAGIFHFIPVKDEAGQVTDFRFSLANRMLAAYVGQDPEAIAGCLGSQWFPAYKKNGLFEKYKTTYLSGSTNRFEFHYNEDGIDVWLDIMCTRVGDGVLVTFTDYTALKNLQRRQEQHVKELRDSNANLEQFAYIASHDLQEPLRKVKAFGDMLQLRYQDQLGVDGNDLIARMQAAAARMSTLIDDLLDYSRAAQKRGESAVVDTNKMLDGVLLDLERTIVQKKATVRRDRLLPTVGQATQIGQIFLNLVGNALKFSRPGVPPEVQITCLTVKGNQSGIAVMPEDADKDFQLVCVSDNGIGFDMEYKERIFQIFQRLNIRSEYPGSGVGLSIVKKVVENHGGYISAEAIQGAGTRFYILLPLVPDSRA